jgi:hypothetical protein
VRIADFSGQRRMFVAITQLIARGLWLIVTSIDVGYFLPVHLTYRGMLTRGWKCVRL